MTEDKNSPHSGTGDSQETHLPGPPEVQDATLSAHDHEGPTLQGPGGRDTSSARLPEAIGEYRILGILGEGGMGIVYEAEQASPRRRVALKVIRGGQFVDETRVKMFQREAETLARLKHPNIGSIYESGRTDDGQHFFAMELVRGKTLDAYLASRPETKISGELEHRLALYRKICEAVQYAHQRGVIHRDLKPSNIVVNDQVPDTGSGSDVSSGSALPTVKILDFGLARITEGDMAVSQMTEVGVIKGTLPYMAPEQARGDAEAIDVRTDVYALGVIAYEMLAGRRPYDTTRPALLEAVRIICQEPPEPLSRTWSGTRKLDPDVETIVGKALEKEPDRRYSSASALSEDVGRFLASQPILARPPSAVYQLRKMVERHRTVFAASIAMTAVLIGATIVSTSLYLKAKRESERARVEALKSDQVATFMAEMLEGVGPEVARGRDTTMLREILDQTAARVGTDLVGQPEVESSVREVLGGTYRELGALEQAEVQLRTAVELSRETLGPQNGQTLSSMNDLALTLHARGQSEEAEKLLLEAVAGNRLLRGDEHTETLVSVSNLGLLYSELGRFDLAEPFYLEAAEGIRRARGAEHKETLMSQTNLGVLWHSMGRLEDAETILHSTVEDCRRVLGKDHPETLGAINALAVNLEFQGKYEQAEPLHFEALEGYRRVVGDDHPRTLQSLANLGACLTSVGRPEEAESYLREALQARRASLGDDHRETLISINTMGFWYFRQGRLDESEAMVREALDRGRRTLGEDHPDFLVWVFNMGRLLQLRGRPAEAESYSREALESRRRVLGPAHPEVIASLHDLAGIVNKLDRIAEAEDLLQEAVQSARTGLGESNPATLLSWNMLASFYRSHDKLEDARRAAGEKLAAMRRLAETSDQAGPKNAFAWEALTCEPASLQDPEAALEFARAAAELSQSEDADILDTLALAHHRTGDNARAVEVASRALGLVAEGDSARREGFEAALVRYREALAEEQR